VPPISTVILSPILRAPLFGYQPMEVMWQRVGNSIVPQAVSGKPQRWFVFDENNDLRLLTKTNMLMGEELPPKKFLLARNEPTYENPYGIPALASCFWPVTFKKGGFKFWVVFAEKYGMPLLWGKLPRGMEQKEYDDLADILENMVKDAIAVTPDDASIEMLTTEGRATGDIYNKLIEACKAEISIAVLGQNLTTEVKGGSFAAATTHMQVRKDIRDDDAGIVESCMNTLIDWTIEYNFAERSGRPRFILYEEEDVDKSLAERDELLTHSGVRFRKSYFVSGYGLAEDDFDVTDPLAVRQSFFSGQGNRGNRAADFAEGDWVDLYMKRIAPTLRSARQSAMEEIEKWLKSLGEPPSEDAFVSKLRTLLGKAYENIDKAAVADAVAEIYTFYKVTDSLVGEGIGIGFGGADARAVDWLSQVDQYYLSKYIQNPDTVKIVTEFLKEKYIEGGAGLFGNADPDQIQAFLDLLEQKMIDVDDWQASRIIDTAVQRTRNWGHISQLRDAAIAEIEIIEPTRGCDFCKNIHGRIIRVEVAYRRMKDLAAMSPAEYEAFLKNPDNAPTLDNIENLVNRGMLPPYHPHCHGRIIKRLAKS